MGKMFNHAIRALGLAEIHDTQCGFKAFRQRVAREIFSRQTIDGFAFDVEVLLLARTLGFSVADLPVQWENSSDSRVHILHDSMEMMWDMLRVRSRVARTMRAQPLRGG